MSCTTGTLSTSDSLRQPSNLRGTTGQFCIPPSNPAISRRVRGWDTGSTLWLLPLQVLPKIYDYVIVAGANWRGSLVFPLVA